MPRVYPALAGWMHVLCCRWPVQLICLVWAIGALSLPVQAGSLADRVAQYPQGWQAPPALAPAQGDLIYPGWFLGQWQAVSTLIDQVAPLAPEVVTPGFEGNRQYLEQPVTFAVRFVSAAPVGPLGIRLSGVSAVVAERAFNSLSVARAYLGDSAVQSVKVDPQSPNRQITYLRGGRQLVSTIQARGVEADDPDTFTTSEFFLQEFRGAPQLYFNRVENTTTYHRLPTDPATIAADQVTAIYLSPQDADYFKAGNRPVALYHYQMTLTAQSNFS